MDLDKMISDLGNFIAKGDYRNARRLIDAIGRYVSDAEISRSPRVPELNDYIEHVYKNSKS